MVYNSRGRGPFKCSDVFKENRSRCICTRYRDIFKRLDRANITFKILRADKIMIPALIVDPEGRIKIYTRIKRCNNILDHVLLGNVQIRRLDTIYFYIDCWIIETLRNPDVSRSIYLFYLFNNRLRDLIRCLQIATQDLDINRRWEAEVEGCREHASCVKCELDPWKPISQLAA